MRKLKLDLDVLAVESFDTEAEQARRRGTLFGRDSGTAYTDCWGLTCPNCDPTALVFCTDQCGSVEETCARTCATCAYSCDGWHTCFGTCVEGTLYDTCGECGGVSAPQLCDE